MGNFAAIACGGGEAAATPLGNEWHRVVLCREGPYTEGFLPDADVRRDPPDGVVAFAAQPCSLCGAPAADAAADSAADGAEKADPVVITKLREGEQVFLLIGEDSDGAGALRFGLGDRVACQCGDGTVKTGTIVGLWYHEKGWRRLAPYQVRVDGNPGQLIFCPHDDPDLIAPHGDDGRTCGLNCSDEPQFSVGDSVVFTGGGRFPTADVPVHPQWALRVGAVGSVLHARGAKRARGQWPVDVTFPAGCARVAIPLTYRDIAAHQPHASAVGAAAAGEVEPPPAAAPAAAAAPVAADSTSGGPAAGGGAGTEPDPAAAPSPQVLPPD